MKETKTTVRRFELSYAELCSVFSQHLGTNVPRGKARFSLKNPPTKHGLEINGSHADTALFVVEVTVDE
jgi:hypothetical protein